MNYWKRHIGDFARDTAHLSQGQVGAYDLLLDWYYANERPLPSDPEDVYRIARAFTKEERKNAARARTFFTAEGHHKRCDEEIANARVQADTNRRIAEEREARKRARKHHESCNESLDEASTKAPLIQTPVSIKEQEPKQEHVPQAARFDEFWSVYPIKRGKKPARDKWKAKRLDETADRLIADVRQRIANDQQWRDGFAPHAATYLHQERWEDELSGRQQARAGPAAPVGKVAQGIANLEAMKHGERDSGVVPQFDSDRPSAPSLPGPGRPASG